MSSSDGWPLKRPDLERQALAVDLGAEARRSAAAGRRRRPPTCTCSGAASCRSGRRSRASSRSPARPAARPAGPRRARASSRRTSASTRSCGSRSMSSSEMPPSIADRRQQHLVGPAAGQDLGEVGGEQRPEVDREALRVVQPERPVDRRPERQAADDQRDRDEAEQPQLLPARSRADRAEDARQRRRAGRRGPRGSHRPSSDRPLEPHPDLADLELVAEADRGDAVDAAAVDVRAVRAAEVLDVPAATAVGQDRVLRRRERVVDDDRVVDVATERR